MVCTAFNADFDGDQMAVHLPLSVEAQAECRFLLLSPNNLLKPSDGGPVAVPSQDMVLGIYYLTQERPGYKGEGKVFKDLNEAILAYENQAITLQTKIFVYMEKHMADGSVLRGKVQSTLGRLLFNEILPQDLGLSLIHIYKQDKIDAVLTNKFVGIPIFAAVMFLVFYISQSTVGTWIADWLVGWIEAFQGWAAGMVENANPFLQALLVDGIIGGVGAVVGFLPLVMVMYFLIALLEDCGYMARDVYKRQAHDKGNEASSSFSFSRNSCGT